MDEIAGYAFDPGDSIKVDLHEGIFIQYLPNGFIYKVGEAYYSKSGITKKGHK
jgi:hypothetical protein